MLARSTKPRKNLRLFACAFNTIDSPTGGYTLDDPIFMQRKRPPFDIRTTRTNLLTWFDAHKRDLPWRRTRDPWAIWVSEVMLQQTRVDTVIPYYTRFMQRFPNPQALADATETDVLALWSGLGYYRRARFLHAGAQRVAEHHGGEVPGDHAALRALPGIGDYTAGAVGSIAFGLPVALVDGNVERVLTRLHGLGGDPRAAPLKKHLWTLAAEYANDPRSGDTNQSLMELGAMVCTPTSPQCLVCPVRAQCRANAEGNPERYPEKKARAAVREESWNALIARSGDGIWLVESTLGRWQGMLITPMHPEEKTPPSWGVALEHLRKIATVRHILTHARMSITVWEASLLAKPAYGRLVQPEQLTGLAIPKITRRVLEATLSF
jgi:A/G-specific adenine glycosylase